MSGGYYSWMTYHPPPLPSYAAYPLNITTSEWASNYRRIELTENYSELSCSVFIEGSGVRVMRNLGNNCQKVYFFLSERLEIETVSWDDGAIRSYPNDGAGEGLDGWITDHLLFLCLTFNSSIYPSWGFLMHQCEAILSESFWASWESMWGNSAISSSDVRVHIEDLRQSNPYHSTLPPTHSHYLHMSSPAPDYPESSLALPGELIM